MTMIKDSEWGALLAAAVVAVSLFGAFMVYQEGQANVRNRVIDGAFVDDRNGRLYVCRWVEEAEWAPGVKVDVREFEPDEERP